MSALLVIDVQNDFMDDGPFKLKGASSVVEPINELLKLNWKIVIASRDWHPANHQSFASSRGVGLFDPVVFKTQHRRLEVPAWPDHCVENTWGAQFHSKLNSSRFDKIVDKGTDPEVECFSAFRDIFQETETGLAQILRDSQISRVYVVGLVTDFCVSCTAIDAAEYGFITSVVTDCVFAYNQPDGVDCMVDMVTRGVEIISSKDIPLDLS